MCFYPGEVPSTHWIESSGSHKGSGIWKSVSLHGLEQKAIQIRSGIVPKINCFLFIIFVCNDALNF